MPMSLSEVEKFVFHRGLLGCNLTEIPNNLLAQIPTAETLEIVHAKNSESIPQSINDPTYSSVEYFTLDQIQDLENYVIRPRAVSWKKVLFDGRNLHSGNIAMVCSLLLKHPEGLTRKELKSQIPNSEKSISKWLRLLAETGTIFIKTNEEFQEFIYFNFDLFDNIGKAREKIEPEASSNLKRSKNISNIVVDQDMIEKAIDAVKDHPNGIPIKSLKMFLNANDQAMKVVIEKFKAMENYEVVENNGTPQKIQFSIPFKSEYANAETINFLVDMCKSFKIILLSEQPKELKKLKAAMGIDDLKLIEILEDNEFKTIEIRYKYMNSDFVLFSSDVEETNSFLIETFEKAKMKIGRYFKNKVQNTFFKNISLTAFDNNYSPCLEERIRYFYNFILNQMKKNNMYFVFTNEILLEMPFLTFVKAVPLRVEFQFIEIMIAVLKYKKIFPKNRVLSLDQLSLDEYNTINNECLKYADRFTLGEILRILNDDNPLKKSLKSRINVVEFEKILLLLIKYNIFEGFFDLNYIYFESIDGIGNYIEKILSTIKDDSEEQSMTNFAPYPVRKELYNKISSFSPDEFYSKTKELLEDTSEMYNKEFFMKKLQGFE